MKKLQYRDVLCVHFLLSKDTVGVTLLFIMVIKRNNNIDTLLFLFWSLVQQTTKDISYLHSQGTCSESQTVYSGELIKWYIVFYILGMEFCIDGGPRNTKWTGLISDEYRSAFIFSELVFLQITNIQSFPDKSYRQSREKITKLQINGAHSGQRNLSRMLGNS